MKRLLGASALLSLFLCAPAYAQQATSICVQSVPPGNCFPVSAGNPLPVTGGGGGVSSNITQWGSVTLGGATAVGTEATGNVVTVNAHLTGGSIGNVTITSPLGHATADAAAVSVVPSATAVFPATQSTSPWIDSITQWGGGTLGAMANYGTSPGAVLVPGVNASVTNVVSSNTAQVNGVTTLTGAGATGTGSQRETVAQDTTTIAGSAPGTAGSASTNVISVQGVASGTALPTSADPCSYAAKTSLAISTNATSLAQIIAASGSTKIYVCSLSLIAAGATAFNLNGGTSTNCGSSTAALLGSTTAANGLSFVAGGGMTLGNGSGSVLITAASSEICTLQSNAVYVSGSMTYVQQ